MVLFQIRMTETKKSKKTRSTSEEKRIKSEEKDSKEKVKKKISSLFAKERVITESSDEAREFCNQGRFGVLLDDGKVQLSLLDASFLLEKGRIEILDGRNKKITFESFIRKAQHLESNFWIRYRVFKDLRGRGYIVKTAFKFGANFRVYDRGVKPGEDHARWIVYPVHESSTLTWHEFSAKNRVAHSTRKRLLIGVVDEENDVTYYEIKWMRP